MSGQVANGAAQAGAVGTGPDTAPTNIAPRSIAPPDIEAIESATLDAVPPQARQEMRGWLLALDDGTVGRAHSAVPLRHDGASASCRSIEEAADLLQAIERAYAQRGLRAMLRLPMLPAFEPMAEALRRSGYAQAKPTCVWTGSVTAMVAHLPGAARGGVSATSALPGTGVADATPALLMTEPDDGWRAVFLGEGFDPVDGASRVRILGRAKHAAFAAVRDPQSGQAVAAGMGSYSHGWGSIHGMRTLAPWRGRRMAGRILSALALEARMRGIERMFLQVEAGNAVAQSLYRRVGFGPAWDYAYWSRAR